MGIATAIIVIYLGKSMGSPDAAARERAVLLKSSKNKYAGILTGLSGVAAILTNA
jgi:hypothetical protein